MPSITLSGLTATTPDGRTLFSNLDLSFDGGRTGLVGRNGVGKTTLLGIMAGMLSPQAGTVSTTGTLGVLRQTVQVAADEALADLMGVAGALDVLRRAEEGRATADELASADWTIEARIASALRRVGLDAEPSTLLSALSGGQRTRRPVRAGPGRTGLHPAGRTHQQSRSRGARVRDRAAVDMAGERDRRQP